MQDTDAHRSQDGSGNSTDWPQRLTVTRPEAAAVLTEMRRVAFLRAFMTTEGTAVGEAARHFGLSPNATYRRVKQFEALGLLRFYRSLPRSGKAIRLYRGAAQSFFLPRELYPLETWLSRGFQAQFGVFNSQLAQALEAGPNPVGGLLVGETAQGYSIHYAGSDGELWNPQDPGTTVMYSGFRTLQLDYERAKAFHAELRAVVSRYAGEGGSTPYMLGLFLTPLTDVERRDPRSNLQVD